MRDVPDRASCALDVARTAVRTVAPARAIVASGPKTLFRAKFLTAKMLWGAVALTGSSVFGWWPQIARASTYYEALDTYERGRRDTAIRQFEHALKNPNNGPYQLATIYVHLGVLRLHVGRYKLAYHAFDRALAIRRSIRLPAGAPASARRMFRRVSERRRKSIRVAVRLPRKVAYGRHTTIRLRALHQPRGLVRAARVKVHPAGSQTASWRREVELERGMTPVVLPASLWRGTRALDLEVELLDEYGGTVAVAERLVRSLGLSGPPRGTVSKAHRSGGAIANRSGMHVRKKRLGQSRVRR